MKPRSGKQKKTLGLDQAIEAFLESERRQGKTVLTLINYRADLAALLRSMGDHARTDSLAGGALRHLEQLQLAHRSWNRHLSTLRRFCQFMVEDHQLARNPLRSIERARVPGASPKPAAPDDVSAVIERVENPRDRALVALLWEHGLRISEALRLRRSDVDLRRGTLTVRQGMQRSLALSPRAQLLLTGHLRSHSGLRNDPLFSSYSGRPLSYAGAHRLFRRYAGITGLTMQRLRAAAAVAAFARGATLTQVQNMLGHLHPASTARYRADADTQGVHNANNSTKKQDSKSH